MAFIGILLILSILSKPAFFSLGTYNTNNPYGGIFALSPTATTWSLYFKENYISKFSSAGPYLLGQYKSELRYSYFTSGTFASGNVGLTGLAGATSISEHKDQLFVTLKSNIYLSDGPRSTSILKNGQPLTTPLFTTTKSLATFDSMLFAVDSGLFFSQDNEKTWKYLTIPDLDDKSATFVIKHGNKLIVSYSKGLLISATPQQLWQFLPLNLNNQPIKKMFTNGTDLFCLTEDGSVYQISGL